MKSITKTTTAAVLAAALSLLGADLKAEDSNENRANSPHTKADGSWISLQGTAKNSGAYGFDLVYNSGVIHVEMDDWDNEAEGFKIVDGDKVTVYGAVDNDLFERTTIEAGSAYVESLNTFYFANSADEEAPLYNPDVGLEVGYDLSIRGKVTEIIGREMMVDTGYHTYQVDTINLPYNPMDSESIQKLEIGDRVSVRGNIDTDWWEKQEIMAGLVIKLKDVSRTKKQTDPDS